jgi:DNA repair protein RadD
LFTLRPYQVEAEAAVYSAWAGDNRNVLLASPTGSGKTVLFARILAQLKGAGVAVAHRQELVSQISLALAHYGVPHTIIGPKPVVKWCSQLHTEEVGRSFYKPGAPIAVAGVDTLIRRKSELAQWCKQVRVWVMDEGHHVLQQNKWGEGVGMFPNAYGLGVTATPERADGKGLGRSSDGVFDRLVMGPSMRELIDQGWLTDYRIFAPRSDLNTDNVAVSQKTGDFNQTQLRVEAHRSQIHGDVVEHYLTHCRGMLGLTFTVDVEEAVRTANAFNAAGVPAAALSAKTPDRERTATVRRFRRRELLQLVNVDLFGEGFDLPAIECISMARPTDSYGLFVQQFGRGLRPLDGKDKAIIIDHVGNVERHGLPDAPRRWSLQRRDTRKRKGRDPDAIPMQVCVGCTSPFEVIYRECPFCGFPVTPERRDGPEYVDGDLVELDEYTLAAMRGDVERIDEDMRAFRSRMLASGMPKIAAYGAAKQHERRQNAQTPLRRLIQVWAARQRGFGRPDSESYRRFYHRYGTDVMSAQSLGRKDANQLACTLLDDLK